MCTGFVNVRCVNEIHTDNYSKDNEHVSKAILIYNCKIKILCNHYE